MSEQLIEILKLKMDSLSIYGQIGQEEQRNAIKEELQLYALDFIYHHPEYKEWIMYGGSALRIIHQLNRMSVDLDFEVSKKITPTYLEELKKEIETFFSKNYGADKDFLVVKIVNNRGLLLKFNIAEALELGGSSNQVHLKIDLNHFIPPKDVVIDYYPVNTNQLSFVIRAYNMSALMASKIAAVLLRDKRIVGKDIFNEKGRDIYDLLWYMEREIIPSIDYLKAKDVKIDNHKELFQKITLKLNKVEDKNLKNDLIPLFLNHNFIENWLKNWMKSYFNLLNNYKIKTIMKLEHVNVFQDGASDNFYFTYTYQTKEGKPFSIVYALTDYWIEFAEGNLLIEEDADINKITEFNNSAGSKKLKQYISLFNKKNERYLKKMDNVLLGDTIKTKLIRMTTDKFNQNEQIILDKSTLLDCDLEDLLK
jgi:hypothetical protein